jgi:hypothetical protein
MGQSSLRVSFIMNLSIDVGKRLLRPPARPRKKSRAFVETCATAKFRRESTLGGAVCASGVCSRDLAGGVDGLFLRSGGGSRSLLLHLPSGRQRPWRLRADRKPRGWTPLCRANRSIAGRQYKTGHRKGSVRSSSCGWSHQRVRTVATPSPTALDSREPRERICRPDR